MSLLDATSLGYRIGGLPILRGIDFEINEGELIGLIGPNGAGKSTLLRLFTQVESPSDGEIRFDGHSIDQLSAEDRARRIAYLVQGARAYWPFSVEKLVGLGRIPHQKWWQQASSEDHEKVLQDFHYVQLVVRVECRHRFVGEDQLWFGGHDPCQHYERVFATGECGDDSIPVCQCFG